jgi:hypothetical protein
VLQVHRLHHGAHRARIDLREIHEVPEHAVDRFTGAHDLLRHGVAADRIGGLAEDVRQEQQRLHRAAAGRGWRRRGSASGRAGSPAGPARAARSCRTSTAFCWAASTASRSCDCTMCARRTSIGPPSSMATPISSTSREPVWRSQPRNTVLRQAARYRAYTRGCTASTDTATDTQPTVMMVRTPRSATET